MTLPRFLFSVLPYRKFIITGSSMEPIYQHGDIVLVNTWIYRLYRPKKNDVIALYHPHIKKPIIKRIKAITQSGIFVMGDHYQKSTDSRDWGKVPKALIIGKVVAQL